MWLERRIKRTSSFCIYVRHYRLCFCIYVTRLIKKEKPELRTAACVSLLTLLSNQRWTRSKTITQPVSFTLHTEAVKQWHVFTAVILTLLTVRHSLLSLSDGVILLFSVDLHFEVFNQQKLSLKRLSLRWLRLQTASVSTQAAWGSFGATTRNISHFSIFLALRGNASDDDGCVDNIPNLQSLSYSSSLRIRHLQPAAGESSEGMAELVPLLPLAVSQPLWAPVTPC